MNERPSHSRVRWLICALLFFSTTVNYVDRQVISYLKEYFCLPVGQGGFGWSNQDFSFLTSAFTGMYAAMTIVAGWFIDVVGTRVGLAVALTVWSVFGALNAFAGRLLAMHIFVRSAFAIGEAGNFPASIKTVAEWFPKRERAFATGIFNAGTNVGAMIAAILVPYILARFGFAEGWKIAFFVTGCVGCFWLIPWLAYYDVPGRHPKVSPAELALINESAETEAGAAALIASKVPWPRLFRLRQTWAFAVGKFLTDGIWWFYLFWLPDYLLKQFGYSKEQVIVPTFIVYGVAIIGSVYGGGLPMQFIARGYSVYRARMLTMLLIALCPVVVLFTEYFGNVARFGPRWAPILAVATICVGAAAHQAWSANLFTTVSDMFPKQAVGSATGIGTLVGGIGGVAVQLLAGRLNDVFAATPHTAYFIMFIVCATSYLIAWVCMKALVPRPMPVVPV